MRTLRMRVRSECHLRFACPRAYAGDYRVGVAVHEDLVTWEGECEKTDGLHDLRQCEVAGAYVDQLGVRTVGGADGPKTTCNHMRGDLFPGRRFCDVLNLGMKSKGARDEI